MMKFTRLQRLTSGLSIRLAILVEMEKKIKESKGNLDKELLKEAKRLEFPDNVIARLDRKD